MPTPLKELYFTDKFIAELAAVLTEAWPDFPAEKFHAELAAGELQTLELKDKMRLISQSLRATLPDDYPEALRLLRQVAPNFGGFDAMVFPDFVEQYGLDDFDLSMEGLAFFTPLCSSEFGVRPFLAQEPERALAYLRRWAEDANEHLRRLASEGCRPRLPWAGPLRGFIADPAPILPILEKLKGDPALYVRKSVANNLNDISKDHPEIVLEIGERWLGERAETDWIVKQASRTLLKKGNPRAMRLFGFGDPVQVGVADVRWEPERPLINASAQLTFTLQQRAETPLKLRLEYVVHFLKKNGKLSPKVFQISEGLVPPGSRIVTKSHSFEQRSTRTHLPGEQQVAIIVNGVEQARLTFELGPAS